ncbi:hypothetical protein STUTZSP0542_10860 [Stutzerimonas marianensis]
MAPGAALMEQDENHRPRLANREMSRVSKARSRRRQPDRRQSAEGRFNEANRTDAVLSGARRHYASFQGTAMGSSRDCPVEWDKRNLRIGSQAAPPT